MSAVDLALAIGGLGVLMLRLQPWRRFRSESTSQHGADQAASVAPLVSIIIPCRNEESNIEPLLRSLLKFDLSRVEILVVDDGSTDQTVARASALEVRVIEAGDKPEGWLGKSWACWRGSLEASGEIFLFTDADTRHASDSLERALQFMKGEKADLVSAPPFHLCENAFEKFLGLFQLLPLIATAYLRPATRTRLYAIGQYLLITRAAYFKVGGHHAICRSLADDIDLAKEVISAKLKYAVYPEASLYQVQMYASWTDFYRGWIRLLRVGMKRTHFQSFIEVTLVFCLLAQFSAFTLIGVALITWEQHRHGHFKILGGILSIASAALFIILSLAAICETIVKKRIVWRDRSYVDA